MIEPLWDYIKDSVNIVPVKDSSQPTKAYAKACLEQEFSHPDLKLKANNLISGFKARLEVVQRQQGDNKYHG
jgi:hypothetical protein